MVSVSAQKQAERTLSWSIGEAQLSRGKDVMVKYPLVVSISDAANTPQLGTSTIRFFYDAGYLESVSVENVENGYEVSGYNLSKDVYGEVFGFAGGGGVFAQFDIIANNANLINLSETPVHILDFTFRVKPGAKIPLCAALVLDNNSSGSEKGNYQDVGYLVNDSGIVGTYFMNKDTRQTFLADDEVHNFMWSRSIAFDKLIDKLEDRAGRMVVEKSAGCLQPQQRPETAVLRDFRAKKLGLDQAVLDWRTSSEFNNDFFDVQRSEDGLVFETISTVRGQWNATETTTYQFLDEEVKPGKAYYRLAQVDREGNTKYSAVRTLEFAGQDPAADQLEVSFYPNPSKGITNIRANRFFTGFSLTVLDSRGSMVQFLQNVSSGDVLDLTSLDAGVYNLVLKNEEDDDNPLVKSLVISR
ncbi:hypothetical protein CRP01_32335 [Flavilitoribacter nigricans DSM 23189 = NBRC 102662]|uniref:Secretion system C-terminal sorting domain-containing protein n=2 Tax=Flavilitoribacter TaxID=2762562 RepID=A0A2D0N1G4_FLAN2|nr:hypothetical protein CRP01_32335 [Flavilitoribacter nigricans DSM 23189 = NBRC 102662]